MSEKSPGEYAAASLERFTTALATKGITPGDALVSMWTICMIQMRRSGITSQELADAVITFQRAYTNHNTH